MLYTINIDYHGTPPGKFPVFPCVKTALISGDVDNDSQSDCHSDSNSCAPEVMVSDARVFRMNKNSHAGLPLL
jgi:hypothetical protein